MSEMFEAVEKLLRFVLMMVLNYYTAELLKVGYFVKKVFMSYINFACGNAAREYDLELEAQEVSLTEHYERLNRICADLELNTKPKVVALNVQTVVTFMFLLLCVWLLVG